MLKVYKQSIVERERLIHALIDDYDGRAEWFYSENLILNYETLESVPGLLRGRVTLVTSENGEPLFYSVIVKR